LCKPQVIIIIIIIQHLYGAIMSYADTEALEVALLAYNVILGYAIKAWFGCKI